MRAQGLDPTIRRTLPSDLGPLVQPTDAAARAIAAVCAEGGPVAFLEELGVAELLCLGKDDLTPGRHHVLLGQVGECPVFSDRRNRRLASANGLLLDAFDDLDGPIFTLWPRACGRPSDLGTRW